MTSFRFALLPLLAVLAVECAPPLRANPDAPSTPAHEVVAEDWPDGKPRLRKQVLRLDDGTVVDDGPYTTWYADGAKEYEAIFARGKKEGVAVRYHRNGRVASRQSYRDGQRHGPSTSWNDKGEKVKEENWADGQPHGTWTIWEDGKVAWTHEFVHGDPDP